MLVTALSIYSSFDTLSVATCATLMCCRKVEKTHRYTLITCPFSSLYRQHCIPYLICYHYSPDWPYITTRTKKNKLYALFECWIETSFLSCWLKVSKYDSGLLFISAFAIMWQTRCFIYCAVRNFYFLVSQFTVYSAKLLHIAITNNGFIAVFHWPWEKWNNVLFQGVFLISPQI